MIADSYTGYWNYLINEITQPAWHNYFYWLVGLSLLCWSLEILFPWRKEQTIIRKDFWLDAFYMFFNFFIFSLILYNVLSNIAVDYFNRLLHTIGISNLVAMEVDALPVWTQLGILFILRDFIQWNVHRMLHRSTFLWEFHKVHHSVEEMGFAAHLRYHWMETIVYRTIEYIPLAMIGFSINDFFIVHIIGLAIGHLNHSNIAMPMGWLRFLINNPQMHIWHHARNIPIPYGVNFGLSLSVWDYLFRTAYIPYEGSHETLGFSGLETFPRTFVSQISHFKP